MARYKTPSFKQMAERTYPHRVDIDVPGFGLGKRLDAMLAVPGKGLRVGSARVHAPPAG